MSNERADKKRCRGPHHHRTLGQKNGSDLKVGLDHVVHDVRLILRHPWDGVHVHDVTDGLRFRKKPN